MSAKYKIINDLHAHRRNLVGWLVLELTILGILIATIALICTADSSLGNKILMSILTSVGIAIMIRIAAASIRKVYALNITLKEMKTLTDEEIKFFYIDTSDNNGSE